jgi:hypothetical protein
LRLMAEQRRGAIAHLEGTIAALETKRRFQGVTVDRLVRRIREQWRPGTH